jgi:hypothetical protein
MSTQVIVLEQVTLTAPFGVRFWDVSANMPAGSGLFVTAYPNFYPELLTTATESPSGVYSFSGLPGLRRAENGAGDDAFWSANPPICPYTIQVRDPEERYLSYRFSALLPVRGLFGLWNSPLLSAMTPDSTWLPIFSSPARPIAGPIAMVQAQLQDTAGEFAAWAIVTVQAPGLPLRTGLADDRGVVSISQPYPEPSGNGLVSPLSAPRLTDQSWPATVAVFYTAGKVDEPLPDLDQILQQSAAVIWRDTALTTPVNQFSLQFGQDLILRSLDSTSGNELSVLLVTPVRPPLGQGDGHA